jgi:hypothetical protein
MSSALLGKGIKCNSLSDNWTCPVEEDDGCWKCDCSNNIGENCLRLEVVLNAELIGFTEQETHQRVLI